MKKITLFFSVCLLGKTILFSQPSAPIGKWVSMGPEHITKGMGANGRITSLAIDPTSPKIIYGGARGTGLWKTVNGGESWTPITDNLPSLNIQAVAIAKTNHNSITIITPSGVFRSLNAGATWSIRYDGNLNVLNNSLIIHPNNPNLLYIAGQKEGPNNPPGVYLSKDGGNSWNNIFDMGKVSSLQIDPLNNSRFYAGVYDESDVSKIGIYEGFNDGANTNNWRKLTGCPGSSLPTITDPKTIIKLALSRGRIYASFKNSTSWTIYRTTELGCSIGGRQESSWKKCWSPTGSIGDDPVFRRLWNTIYTDPNNRDIVFASGTDLWVSTNGGDDFTRIPEGTSSTPHADYHAYHPDPSDSKIVFFGTDGGIYRSSNHGLNNWSFVGKGMAVTEFYNMATASQQINTIVGGTQDNGMSKYTGSKNWKFLIGGDSEISEISPKDNNIYYQIGQRMNQLKKSSDGGSNWSDITAGLTGDCGAADEFGPTFYQVLAHPNNASVVYATCDGLWKGLPWTRIFNPPDGVRQVAIDKNNGAIFAGTANGNIHLATNATNFDLIFESSRNAACLDIEIDPENPQKIYFTFQGTSNGRIYSARETNGTFNFIDITSNLPTGLRVNAIAIDLSLDRTIYAGTTSGVYKGIVSLNGNSCSWSAYNNGLPNGVTITDLEVQPITGVLRASTFGRSAYEINTDHPIGSVLGVKGRINYLRVHTVGSGYGSGNDLINAELIIKIDADPQMSFGIQLRKDNNEKTNMKMFESLQRAFASNRPIAIEYTKKSLHSGLVIRIIN